MKFREKLKSTGLDYIDLREIEPRLRSDGYRLIAGVDEAGRGPLAGPVVAAAVILDEDVDLPDLCDSKKLPASRREYLFDRIVSSNARYAVGIVDNGDIDKINILRAGLRAMSLAVNKLKELPDFVLVDGKQTIPHLRIPQMAVICGDDLCRSVSAASIIAKVTRDRIMNHYAKLYPQFNFASHKGYCTPDHLRELEKFGPTPIHRVSYRPVQERVSSVAVEMFE
jgi:ribonuclease HII